MNLSAPNAEAICASYFFMYKVEIKVKVQMHHCGQGWIENARSVLEACVHQQKIKQPNIPQVEFLLEWTCYETDLCFSKAENEKFSDEDEKFRGLSNHFHRSFEKH